MTEMINKTPAELSKKELIDRYTITVNNIVVDISIYSEQDKPVPEYIVSITNISDATKIILEKIRQEFISKMNLEEIESLEQNELSDPMLTPYGYHLIYVREKIPGKILAFEEMREGIADYLSQQELQKSYEEMIEELKSRVFVRKFTSQDNSNNIK